MEVPSLVYSNILRIYGFFSLLARILVWAVVSAEKRIYFMIAQTLLNHVC